jgi:hypothetical protein
MYIPISDILFAPIGIQGRTRIIFRGALSLLLASVQYLLYCTEHRQCRSFASCADAPCALLCSRVITQDIAQLPSQAVICLYDCDMGQKKSS